MFLLSRVYIWRRSGFSSRTTGQIKRGWGCGGDSLILRVDIWYAWDGRSTASEVADHVEKSGTMPFCERVNAQDAEEWYDEWGHERANHAVVL